MIPEKLIVLFEVLDVVPIVIKVVLVATPVAPMAIVLVAPLARFPLPMLIVDPEVVELPILAVVMYPPKFNVVVLEVVGNVNDALDDKILPPVIVALFSIYNNDPPTQDELVLNAGVDGLVEPMLALTKQNTFNG